MGWELIVKKATEIISVFIPKNKGVGEL